MDMTPKDLAKQLGITGRTLRAYLRSRYRPNGEDKYSRWKLDEEMAADAVRRLGTDPSAPGTLRGIQG